MKTRKRGKDRMKEDYKKKPPRNFRQSDEVRRKLAIKQARRPKRVKQHNRKKKY